MKRQILSVVCLPVLVAATTSIGYCAPESAQTEQKQPSKKPRATADSLTGCIDQQDGRYVLLDGHNMNVVSALEADGFPTEGLAKHMGHTVTVRGTASVAGASPIFKVRSIETVRDTCAPQQQQGKQ